MPRRKRADESGCLYHALNRGNARGKIFHKKADYLAFLRVLDEGLSRYSVDLLAFCLMPNHWHMVLRPRKDGAMGQFVGWVTATHTLRYHAHNHIVGGGHVYQGPFKSFPVQDDEHFLTVARYVERNALSAGLCRRAQDWPHGSLHRWANKCDRDPKLLTRWPIRRPSGWVARVNASLSAKELDTIRLSVRRGRPYGDEVWTDSTCERTGLWSTLRPVGRPPTRPRERVQSVPA